MKVFKILLLILLIYSPIFATTKSYLIKNKCCSQLYKLNTSNPGKLEEFRIFFNRYGCELEISEVDLDEVDSDPLTVITHKASQLDERILVEDTSLDIEGADVGINVRWLIDDLEKYLGKKAVWTVLLAYRLDDQVHIFKGEVQGTIVQLRSNGGFGFDPYFLPNGSTKTLAEEKPDQFNARSLAVEALMNNQRFVTRSPLYQWDGSWQKHD